MKKNYLTPKIETIYLHETLLAGSPRMQIGGKEIPGDPEVPEVPEKEVSEFEDLL